ncbi:MAG: hypothetical protein D3916_07165 [Candidatus Electrothrix sp. MAN1_4]|nr:hypothetical protein [Candidatus Electrothrix sp. MAN1_4]
MKAKGKPHDPGRDQRPKQRGKIQLHEHSIQIINRSFNEKAHSEAVKLAGGRPRNANLSLSRIRLFSVYPALPSMSKDTGRAES